MVEVPKEENIQATEEADDPVIERFLEFLTEDMRKSSSRITELPTSLRDRVAALVEETDVDLDAEVTGDVALLGYPFILPRQHSPGQDLLYSIEVQMPQNVISGSSLIRQP